MCGELYVGETGRSLGQRVEEHVESIEKTDSKSALSQHQETTGHIVCTEPLMDNIKIVEKEVRDKHRKVLEAINIKLKGASLNRHEGMELSGVYLSLLKEEEGARGDQH